MHLSPLSFHKKIKNKTTNLISISNEAGMQAYITNYGARLVALMYPPKEGKLLDLVLGFDTIDGYLNAEEKYFGATIGRYANRIAKARYTRGNKIIFLENNLGENCLHGGSEGFHQRVWDTDKKENDTVTFSLESPDGESGFEGNLICSVTYQLKMDNSLLIRYHATTNKPTPFGMTHHSFFNLNGTGSGSVLGHHLKVYADKFLPTTADAIPTGVLESVGNTPFDFRKGKRILENWDMTHTQLKYGNGFDHSYIIKDANTPCAIITGDKSGLSMEVSSNQPAMQFYTSNYLSGNDLGKGGFLLEKNTAFCLETQHFPDAPNQSHFPSAWLYPNEDYAAYCSYRFF